MLKFVIPVACTYVNHFVMKLEHNLLIDCLPYEWRSGTSDGLFLPIYPPRGMRSSTLLEYVNRMFDSIEMIVHLVK